jgi:hypothetical protein|nr:MAG TPA: Major head protein [Bacteriophage sp.]
MAAENNLIKKDDLARAREIEFVNLFGYSIKKLVEALGVTRKIPKAAGTMLKSYKAVGTLQDGLVAEGDTIPLSKYKTVPVNYEEITLKKWRKATSAEAIIEKGYDQAVVMTGDEMLKDVQKGIRKNFFDFLSTGTGSASGKTFQAALAQAWGQLQVLFEDDEIQAVYFMNPLDVADYLATAQISLQNAFGMTYVENFLGLGTVIFNSSVPKGSIYATAKDNIVLYYIPVNGADLDEAFTFTSDATGYIGIHETPDYDNMTCKDTVISGIVLFAERIDGIVVSTITGDNTLGTLTVTSIASATDNGKTKITVSPSKGAGNSYKYKIGESAQTVTYGKSVQTWAAWDGSEEITAETGKIITVVECDGSYKAVKAGSKAVVAKDE